MDPALEAELQQPAVLVFTAVEVILPDHAIRLLDGSGTLTLGGNVFTGRDDTYGVLGGLEPVNEGLDGQAPTLVIRFLPPTNTAVADLASPTAQGSIVNVWVGAIDRTLGVLVGAPELIFAGETDVPTLTVDRGSRVLEFACITAFELLFTDSEGALLNNAFHQSLYPAELGFEYVTDVQRDLPWGSDAPRSPAISDVDARINATAANYRG